MDDCLSEVRSFEIGVKPCPGTSGIVRSVQSRPCRGVVGCLADPVKMVDIVPDTVAAVCPGLAPVGADVNATSLDGGPVLRRGQDYATPIETVGPVVSHIRSIPDRLRRTAEVDAFQRTRDRRARLPPKILVLLEPPCPPR